MNDLILKIGCFLTGRNYKIVKSCSEASAKSVKKYLSAILIVSILWGFIGFSFTQRYIKGDIWTSMAVAAILVFIVIHIERQIILSFGKNRWSRVFRIIIGFVMAIIGSVIIDQVLFKEDVEKKNVSNIQAEVEKVLPFKTNQIDKEIKSLDTLIALKEKEKLAYIEEVTRKPHVKSSKIETITLPSKVYRSDGTSRDTLITKSNVTIEDKANPKAEFIPLVDAQISDMLKRKDDKEKSKLTIREDIEKELKSKTGFLDELLTLFSILTSSFIALFVWISFFTFFLTIELFVLTNKFGDHADDYDEVVMHQMNIHKLRLSKLTETY